MGEVKESIRKKQYEDEASYSGEHELSRSSDAARLYFEGKRCVHVAEAFCWCNLRASVLISVPVEHCGR